MKKAMTNVDVAAIINELNDRILGGFVGKAYQQSSDKIWLSVQSPTEGRLDLLLQAGKRVHITKLERPVSKSPPQFPAMLRSRLAGGKIVSIRHHDFDRVMEIEVEKSGSRNFLIAELFPKGSIVLLDDSRTIVTMLRKMVYRGRKMSAKEKYIFHPGQLDPRTITLSDLATWLIAAGQDVVRSLVRGLNMSGTYSEEVCLLAGVHKNKPASDLDETEIARIHHALRDVFVDETLDPHIIYQNGIPLDVLSRPLHIYDGLERKHFATFSEALDFFFEEKEEEKAPVDPLMRRFEAQCIALKEYESQEKAFIEKGEAIYQRFGIIDSLLKVIVDAREKGYSYQQIWEKIHNSKHSASKSLCSLDNRGEIKAIFDGIELDLNAKLSVPQNAQRYYEKANALKRKASGAKTAMAMTKELMTSKTAPKKTKSNVIKRRKPKWYERFHWFFSSDGFLVLGGRDAEANEEIFAKYLEKRDFALHTDAPGAPLTVIKTEGEEIPERTILEAAQFSVSYSSVWKSGLVSSDCYLIKGYQVSKTPEHGEYLKKGSFVIRGERTYHRDVPLGLAVGISEGVLIGGPTSAVIEKSDPVVEIEPGEFNSEDLAKMIYRKFSEKEDDRTYLKSIASVDQIIRFLPAGGSRVKTM